VSAPPREANASQPGDTQFFPTSVIWWTNVLWGFSTANPYMLGPDPRLGSSGISSLSNTTSSSWATLFKISAVALPLAGLFGIMDEAIQAFLDTQPSAAPATIPNGFTQGFVQSVDFVGNHTLLFSSEYSFLVLSMLSILVAAIALFLALSKTDMGTSAIGALLTSVGTIFVLFAAVNAFTEINEAAIWDSGCTVCGTFPLQLVFGTSTYSAALELGELLIIVGILIFSAIMLKGSAFSRLSGVIGIITALYALAGVFAFSSLSGTDYDIASMFIFVLLTLWGVSVAPRLFKLGKANSSITNPTP
jgi:hypothetical protein